MGTLASSFGDASVAVEFGESLNGYPDRGWLDTSTSERLLSQLWKSEELFFSPTREVLERCFAGTLQPQNPQAVLEIAYGDAEEMLQSALKRKQALYLAQD